MPWHTTVSANANNTGPINGNGGTCLGAVKNPIFQQYADLFDEVKCDGMSLRATCTDPIAPGANFSGLLIGTAIDRSLTTNDPIPTAEVLKTSSAWWARVAVNNSIPRVRRSIWASDLQERSNFYDSDYTYDAIDQYTTLDEWTRNTAWNPAIMLAVQNTVAAAQPATLSFLCQVNFYFTFRNPKGAATGTTGRAADALKQAALSPQAKMAQITEADLVADQQTLLDEDTRI